MGLVSQSQDFADLLDFLEAGKPEGLGDGVLPALAAPNQTENLIAVQVADPRGLHRLVHPGILYHPWRGRPTRFGVATLPTWLLEVG
jgi:hypothetical protein